MDTQPPQQGPSGSKSSRIPGASSNTPVIGTQQECRQQLVHRDAANAATKDMTQDAPLTIVCQTGSSPNKKQHAVQCDYIIMVVNGHQFTVYYTAGVCREPRDPFIAACNGKPPWSSKAFDLTVRTIKHHDVFSSGIVAR
jgi:hypothetical protein